jgi:hypothetical protein
VGFLTAVGQECNSETLLGQLVATTCIIPHQYRNTCSYVYVTAVKNLKKCQSEFSHMLLLHTKPRSFALLSFYGVVFFGHTHNFRELQELFDLASSQPQRGNRRIPTMYVDKIWHFSMCVLCRTKYLKTFIAQMH